MFNFFSSGPSITDIAKETNTKGVHFIDVRSPAEYRSGHAKGAENIPLDIVTSKTSALKNYQKVFVICASGGRSSMATSMLKNSGINAINVPGGTMAWRASGLPMSE